MRKIIGKKAAERNWQEATEWAQQAMLRWQQNDCEENREGMRKALAVLEVASRRAQAMGVEG